MNKCSVNCTEPKTKYCLLSIIYFLFYAEKKITNKTTWMYKVQT